MKRTNFLYVALATMTLATSCAQDDLQSSQAAMSEISFHANMGLKSRATETTTANLTTFNVSAFKTSTATVANYMTNVTYEYRNNKWNSPSGETYFWPVSDELNFYAYAPLSVQSLVSIAQGDNKQQIVAFEPSTVANGTGDYSDASSQVDLIYAVTPGQSKTSNSGNVSLNFKHALSEISVMALNTNSAYEVKVTGMKIGNVVSKGTYKLPATTVDASTTSTPGTWTLSQEDTDKKAYTAIFGNNSTVTLTGTAQYVDGSTNATGGNDAVLNAFMLIPQQCAKGASGTTNSYSIYKNGHYIALKVTITMKSGDVVYDDKWAYVGIDTQWEQGKHYTYVLDFSKGAGQQEDGNPVFGPEINISTVSVTEWDGTSAGTKITYSEINGSSGPTVTKNTDI